MPATQRSTHVFINCPFDPLYEPILHAIVFAVQGCGYVARSAQEVDDAGEVRISKISRIIAACRLGIHDISRTELDPTHQLPRFNMPLELGMFLGAQQFGGAAHRGKLCLILDRERYRYQRYLSDIAGQDINDHGDDPNRAIAVVRDWLSKSRRASDGTLPGGPHLAGRYAAFRGELPPICAALKLVENNLIYKDYANIVTRWVKGHP